MITEDYVSFDTAKLLKEKGFPQNPYVCNTAYTSKGNLSNNAKSFVHNSETYEKCGVKPLHYSMAPTLQMAMKWLREVHKIDIATYPTSQIELVVGKGFIRQYTCDIFNDTEFVQSLGIITGHEKACETAIKYCLENLI